MDSNVEEWYEYSCHLVQDYKLPLFSRVRELLGVQGPHLHLHYLPPRLQVCHLSQVCPFGEHAGWCESWKREQLLPQEKRLMGWALMHCNPMQYDLL